MTAPLNTDLPLMRIQRIEANAKRLVAVATMELCPSCNTRRATIIKAAA